ncbi:MAG: HaeIII family restriction endonuclease [Clostridiales bacterium]|nr:HaeIII family restriction endonuclease [Clostridiales bacterium]
MSSKSNNQGRAYEYICLLSLYEEIYKIRPVEIEENSSFFAAKTAFETISEDLKQTLKESALAAVYAIFDREPLILEDDSDVLILKIQSDSKGKEGDVRDILIIRSGIQWEIGLSLKHNHFAVKHSRLVKNLDFGEKWFDIPCSNQYWNDIKPIFDYLDDEKKKHNKWSDLPDKAQIVYIPLLTAFKNEIIRRNKDNSDLPKKMVEYLLGEFDFYKVISIDSRHLTQIQTYNLRGTLNRNGIKTKRKFIVPLASLPTRIVHIDFKPGSDNTVELYLDGGWQFSFRIHNASTYVETSLKFDVQIVGMPTSIISIDCKWN